ncbi:PilW family protein [Alishewanella jeotgali]|uniref:PilW family protein n=1 Tax=Alishewanella jeotgali TaxID=545533 RepID=UPI001ED8F415|nr:prepilin cleavage protein [Alishewanella jeotgali]
MVELLIALTLGIVVLGGGIQIFISGQQAYNEAQRFNRLQSDLSLISDFLASDIRAGNIVGTAPTLILIGPEGTTEYRLEANNTLVRQVGLATPEILSQNISGFNTSCLSVGGNDCPTAIGVSVQLSMRATNTNLVTVNFRVGVRNNILTRKFGS